MTTVLLLGIVVAALASLAIPREVQAAETAPVASPPPAQTSSSDPWTRFDAFYHASSKKFGVPWRWLKAIAIIESNQGQAASVAYGIQHPDDEVRTVSADGFSYGVMQLTLATANRNRLGAGRVTARMLNDPATSIDLAAKYLQELMQHYFPGDRESVIRGYNGGPGFKHTASGLRDTPKYYQKFLAALAQVVAKQPGDEDEIG